jgi:hypothetical protein
MDKQTHRQTSKERDRQIDGRTDRQTDGWTDGFMRFSYGSNQVCLEIVQSDTGWV